MMKFRQLLAVLVLSLVLFSFPLSAQAASSSGIKRSFGNEQLESKNFSGQSLVGADYTNVNLEEANFSNTDLRGGIFNGSVLKKANLHSSDFSNGIAYLVDFQGADFTDAILVEAMLLRSTFNDVDITGADFTDAVLDGTELKKLCTRASGVNSKTGVSTRESLGCK